LTKGPKIYNGEKITSSTNVAGKSGYPSGSTSINSKWIKDLNIRLETLKLLQEGAGNTLQLTGIGKDFLHRTPAAQQLKKGWTNGTFKKLLHNKKIGL
jgi:hypothetical protein